MSRMDHPSNQRHRLRVVADAQSTSEWWAAERAAAHRDQCVAQLVRTTRWCVVALTVLVVAVTVTDSLRGR